MLMQVRSRLLDDRVERRGIRDGDLAEHLAVEGDTRVDQGRDESAVADPQLPASGTQARDPQLAEQALLLLAVLVGVDVGLAGEFQGRSVILSGLAHEAAGALEDA